MKRVMPASSSGTYVPEIPHSSWEAPMEADFFVYPDGRITHVLSGEPQTLEEALKTIIELNEFVVPCDHARILTGDLKGDYRVENGDGALGCCLMAIESIPEDVDPRISPDGVGRMLREDGSIRILSRWTATSTTRH
jgi:hypothetical protein